MDESYFLNLCKIKYYINIFKVKFMLFKTRHLKKIKRNSYLANPIIFDRGVWLQRMSYPYDF